MKKLLGLMGATSLVALSSSAVIACGPGDMEFKWHLNEIIKGTVLAVQGEGLEPSDNDIIKALFPSQSAYDLYKNDVLITNKNKLVENQWTCKIQAKPGSKLIIEEEPIEVSFTYNQL